MSKYRKIDPRIWNDEKFRGFTDRGKLCFLFLLTHPHMTAAGAMRSSAQGLAAEIKWSERAFAKAFREVLKAGMAEMDASACLLAIPNFIKYNRPENPNVLKAWVASLDLLPECPLKNRVITRLKAFAEELHEGFGEALPEGFGDGLPNPEQEPEPDPELEQEPPAESSSGNGIDDGPLWQEFIEFWKEYPGDSGTKGSKRGAFDQYKKRRNEGVEAALLLSSLVQYKAHLGEKPWKSPMQAKRYLGKQREYESHLSQDPSEPTLEGFFTRYPGIGRGLQDHCRTYIEKGRPVRHVMVDNFETAHLDPAWIDELDDLAAVERSTK